MKIVILLISTVLSIQASYAQKMKKSEVPAKVKETFAKKYPGIKSEKWEKENNSYEVEFDLNKIESSALFDSIGNFKELEQEIKISELPKSAISYCTKNLSEFKISEAAKITDAGGKISFEAEMKKGKEHYDVIFDEMGSFIKKVGAPVSND